MSDSAVGRPCPRCRDPLGRLITGRASVAACRTCGAKWVERAFLSDMALASSTSGAPLPLPVPAPELTGWPACPRDATPLVPHRWDGVEIGLCPACHGALVGAETWQALFTRLGPATARAAARGSGFMLVEAVLAVLDLMEE